MLSRVHEVWRSLSQTPTGIDGPVKEVGRGSTTGTLATRSRTRHRQGGVIHAPQTRLDLDDGRTADGRQAGGPCRQPVPRVLDEIEAIVAGKRRNLLDLAYVHPPSAVGKTPHPRLARLSPSDPNPLLFGEQPTVIGHCTDNADALGVGIKANPPVIEDGRRRIGDRLSDRHTEGRRLIEDPVAGADGRPFPVSAYRLLRFGHGLRGVHRPAGFGSLSEAVHGPVGFRSVHGASPYRLESGLAQRLVDAGLIVRPKVVEKVRVVEAVVVAAAGGVGGGRWWRIGWPSASSSGMRGGSTLTRLR